VKYAEEGHPGQRVSGLCRCHWLNGLQPAFARMEEHPCLLYLPMAEVSVDAIGAGWLGRAQALFSVGETYRFFPVFFGSVSLAIACEASLIIIDRFLVGDVKCRLALLNLRLRRRPPCGLFHGCWQVGFYPSLVSSRRVNFPKP
jgi:hypothetical protein